MTWDELLRRGSVEVRPPDEREVRGLQRAANRQLADAAVSGLSAEASFQLAYTGVLELATAAVRSAGYRMRLGEGHHRRTLEAAALALGKAGRDLTDFFELCRRKRNVIQYEGSEATESEARDLLKSGSAFAAVVSALANRKLN